MPIPLLGLLGGAAARIGITGAAKKLAGKALRFVTKGRLIGQGGGTTAVRRIGGAVLTAATAVPVGRAAYDAVRRSAGSMTPIAEVERQERIARAGGEYGGYRRYRRINPMNVRALRRSVRRINAAEKLFRQVFTITKGQVNVRKARRSR